MAVDTDHFDVLRWRCIGPFRGGRSVAVAGHPTDRQVFYFGACVGGVWKTDDGGTFWRNVSDGFFTSASIGAIGVAESDPDVVYVGTGESCIRANLGQGDGVYKTTDGGRTWANVGLRESCQIGAVRVHPKDPNVVYVAALGNAFGPNEQRGVFRSTDGGDTWERVLFVSEDAGAVDISMDPGNPRVLYASIWQVRRVPWMLSSGGPDSGLFKSTDGGDTWEELSGNEGLPEGPMGKIGVAVSPARPDRVWAIVESREGGLFRSDDAGATWRRISENHDLGMRPWYYSHVFADPRDADTVYVFNVKAWRSTDGGQTFSHITMPHTDTHDLWIDPRDTSRMVAGNDGGGCVTFNAGETWSTVFNQPTGQYYYMTADDQFPYRVYGTQQDGTAVSVASRSYMGAITQVDWYDVGVSESGHVAVKPDDPNIVYSGAIGSSWGRGDSLLRYDHRTGQVRIVSVWPELMSGWGLKDHKYRFQWSYPIVFSPHDPNVLYVAANVVFRSDDEGQTWRTISPDLTRADVSKMDLSGGPISNETTYNEHYGTIFSFAESPHEPGVLWAGSDDGLLHRSPDGGESWENVTPDVLPDPIRIDTIELSRHDPERAYLSGTRYKLNDRQPYLFRTTDGGRTWAKITDGIPEDEFTRVIREDRVRPGMLYAGTESTVYVSFDDGDSWHRLQSNLPVVPITDMSVKDDEIAVSTNGRSFWVLDGLPLLRQMDGAADGPAWLLAPGKAHRVSPPMGLILPPYEGKNYETGSLKLSTFLDGKDDNGEPSRTFLDAGSNPPDGVVVAYYLKDRPEDEVTLTFLDENGGEVNAFSSRRDESEKLSRTLEWVQQQTVPAEAGMNRFVWNMRYSNARLLKGAGAIDFGMIGPLAAPGTYQVRLTVGDYSETRSFELVPDPRVTAGPDDYAAQLDLLLAIRDRLSAGNEAVERVRELRAQVEAWVEQAGGDGGSAAEAAGPILEELFGIEDELVDTDLDAGGDARGRRSRIVTKLAELQRVPSNADYAPTQASYDVFDSLSARLDEQLRRLDRLVDGALSQIVGRETDETKVRGGL